MNITQMENQANWQTLWNKALEARNFAYAPYSNYKVGAALLDKKGNIYSGCNIENIAYTPTICAERTAIFKAISDGEQEFEAIAVVTEDGATPCGVCRQVMCEFGELAIIIGNTKGIIKTYNLKELLPNSFITSQL